MKKRLAIYVVLAIPLAIFTWHTISVTAGVVIGTWIIAGFLVAVSEIEQSGKPTMSAIAITIFLVAGIFFYTIYWAGTVFLGYGGEQLLYLRIGVSTDWFAQDLLFYQHTMLPHLISYGLFALMLGPLLGSVTGWLFTQKRKNMQLETIAKEID